MNFVNYICMHWKDLFIIHYCSEIHSYHIDDIDSIPISKLNQVSELMKAWGYDSRGAGDVKRFLRQSGALQAIRTMQFNPAEYDSLLEKLKFSVNSVDLTDDWAKAFAHVMGTQKIKEKKLPVGKVFNRAIKELGITENWRQAGYILPEGELLNLGAYNERGYDHRIVGSFFDETFSSLYEGMEAFMKRGAIRVDGAVGMIDIMTKPTRNQLIRLQEMINLRNGEIELEMASSTNRKYESYELGTPTQKIMYSIRKFWGIN